MLTLDIRKDYHSSSINTIRYDEDTSTMYVDFTSNSTYEYYKVPLKIFQQFENVVKDGGSIGHLFHTTIKPYFKYKKIRG